METREVCYVVVGAGSAGCVLANRLSADARSEVALLEAGGHDRSLWVRMPIGYGGAFHHPRLNWRYRAEPCPGIDGRVTYWPRGRVLGGSSSINAMVWIRGQAADYDGWAAAGNPGWAFADLLPLFRRAEANDAGADDWRGGDGPVGVSSTAAHVHPLSHDFVAAAVAAGIPANADFNGATQEGAGLYQISTRAGVRSSAARAYLAPVRHRRTLTVLTGAHATRILFDGTRAIGVEFLRKGRLHRILARREVIVSAGAVATPALLERSGVGAPDRLAALGIAPVRALPGVGENLQDHTGFHHVHDATVPTLNEMLRPWSGRIALGLRWALTRGGPMALSVNQAGGFFRSHPERQRPNLQLYFSPVSYTRAIPGKRRLLSPDAFPAVMLGISSCHPRSRGRIHARSPDPLDPPRIEPGYLSDPSDMDELVEGAHWLRRIAAAAPLAAALGAERAPTAGAATDAEIAAYIRAMLYTIFHPCGTCAMGPDPDAGAVVDARLRVHGLRGLRVADASIFPTIPAGNINAPAIMVGEKASDLLLADRT